MPAIATILDVEPFGARAAPGTGTAFLVLAAFVVSFLLIRTSARLTRSVSWWPGGVQTGSGVHVHHLVWGICLMMLAGFLGFSVPLAPPWWNIAAIVFGVGAGFTMDESALRVRLDDVYWSQEGRMSFDAVVVGGGGAIPAGAPPRAEALRAGCARDAVAPARERPRRRRAVGGRRPPLIAPLSRRRQRAARPP
jgi:hypothetical protein